jgi:uncharacterized protein (TIGR01777 family)
MLRMALGPLRIVIPGGSGQMGTVLARHFYDNGHDVTTIARHPYRAEWKTATWDGKSAGPWMKLIDAADIVINLAGRSVNCRYSNVHRHEILTSRTITTALVGQAIAEAKHPPALWLNASTATIYRHSMDRPMDERAGEIGSTEPGAPAKWGFSIQVATSWERAFFNAEIAATTRRVAMRSAMLMSPDTGGTFDILLRLVRWGLGGRAASGRQYVSWIHDADFIRAVEFLIEHGDLDGAVNLSSPNPLPNREFMDCLRSAWCTSYIGLPAARWMLELGALAMQTETELILKSRRVIPKRLLDAGFEFHFPMWRGACHDLVRRWRDLQEQANANLPG